MRPVLTKRKTIKIVPRVFQVTLNIANLKKFEARPKAILSAIYAATRTINARNDVTTANFRRVACEDFIR